MTSKEHDQILIDAFRDGGYTLTVDADGYHVTGETLPNRIRAWIWLREHDEEERPAVNFERLRKWLGDQEKIVPDDIIAACERFPCAAASRIAEHCAEFHGQPETLATCIVGDLGWVPPPSTSIAESRDDE